MELILHEKAPPLCSSSSCCSLEVRSKDSRVSGNKTGLFFTLNQRGDWERHSSQDLTVAQLKRSVSNAHSPQLSTLLFETEHLRLWETCWGWMAVFCDCHLGSTESSPMGEGSGTTAENMLVHIAREGDCKRSRWNVNRSPLQTNEFKVTSSKAKSKSAPLWPRDYKKTPLHS